jgi:pyruvate,water dikinase
MDRELDQTLILPMDSPLATLERVGGKAASLARLAAAGLPVPPGFHVTTHAYLRFVSENHLEDSILAAAAQVSAELPATLEAAAAQIRSMIAWGTMPEDIALAIVRGYQGLGADDPPVAVRSSATAEDLPETSFAGQQDTYLNLRGGDQVLEAVQRCWESLWTARALGYRARLGIAPGDVALAVVVQQLVPADAAGVLFTANPLSGERGKVMINAAWGLGEALVGGYVTPDTLVVDKKTGAVHSQEISDKEVMTVRLDQGTGNAPVPAEKRNLPVLSPGQAGELTHTCARIEELYGVPLDVEWALSGGQFFILQARPITALPEPPARLDWPLPRPKGRYARSSVIELLPDPLSPLFATLGVPAWNDAYRELALHVGLARAMPTNFLVTINDYAYYDASQFGAWQMLAALPRLIPTAFRWLGRASARWADEARPRYAAAIGAWAGRDLSTAPATQLVGGAQEIVQAAADHYLTIQSGILPVAYMSETLFTSFYTRIIKRRDDPPALDFMLGFDSAGILAEKSLYDLANWTRTQPDLTGYLPPPRARRSPRRTSPRPLPLPTKTPGASSEPGLTIISNASATPSMTLISPSPSPPRSLRHCSKRSSTSSPRRRAARSSARQIRPRLAVWRSKSWPRGSSGCGCAGSRACCGGRSAMRRYARMRSPMWGWAGRSCAACCTRSVGGSPQPMRSPTATTCSGSSSTRSYSQRVPSMQTIPSRIIANGSQSAARSGSGTDR